jgi:hypothetical protein
MLVPVADLTGQYVVGAKLTAPWKHILLEFTNIQKST